jgi:two-component system, NarL family, response regulator DevR
VIVDDHRVFADSLASALSIHGFEVVAVCVSAASAIEALSTVEADVVVCDLRLPDAIGGSHVEHIASLNVARVIMLSAAGDERSVGDALEAGAAGYLTKDQPLADVVAAINTVVEGGTYVPPHLMAAVMARLRRGVDPVQSLTARELDVLRLIAEGATNQAVADRLDLSVHTVRNHVSNLLVKLDAHSKLEAVVAARRLRLLPD